MQELILEMLPAAEGDALLLRYGPQDAPHHVLIDGGRRSTYHLLREKIEQIPLNEQGQRFLELLMITHIDADHIEGIICLLQDEELNCAFGDIWFNDWKHLEPLEKGVRPEHLGAAQGEFLGALLHARKLPWNKAFNGGAVVLPPAPDALPVRTLPGGLELTLVSPSIEALIKLRNQWTKAIEAAGFTPGNREHAMEQFKNKAWTRIPGKKLGDESERRSMDHSEANGSSIAVLARYQGVRLLLSGDAWPHVLRPALDRWREEQPDVPERVALDAFKVPHHGSSKNLTPQLMNVISCGKYLISTSGSRFHHPDVDAIKMIIDEHHGDELPALLFNYRSEDNDFWAAQETCATHYEDAARLVYQFASDCSS